MSKKKHRNTIFRQLILNIVIPVLLSLVILAVINYLHSKSNLEKWNNERNLKITDEISSVHELQDMALEILEDNLNKRLLILSDSLVNYFFAHTDSIEKANLNIVREKLNMDEETEDIYIVKNNGIVVNSTFKKDVGLNLFEFGENHKNYILDIFKNKRFVSERIAVESSTRRLKKYSYQPTLDNKYIIELGVYSKKIDKLVAFVNKRFEQMPDKQAGLLDIDIFVGSEKPFSLSKKETKIVHPEIVQDVFKTKENIAVTEKINGQMIHFSYIFMQRNNSNLYKNAVIAIVSDRTSEILELKREFYKYLLMFGLTIIMIVVLIFLRTRLIVKPIKELLINVNRITDGHLDERAELIGNNEITELTEKFNVMVGELESYTNELEDKVKKRTEEILAQKEEIQKKNKQITDSILYAKRIQTAILPIDESFKTTFKDYFILFKPRDIVSGDFYFLQKVNEYVLFSAVDCTGHGVPGAFMSMMGIAFLNEIVRRKDVTQASQVLNILRDQIKHSLKQTGKRGENREGMDMSFCVINTETNELQFAGAYNPLVIIRNSEILEYKADKMPIGIYRKEKESFTNHTLNLETGDKLYLFSDGFYDQIGGENKEKFLYPNFVNVLKETCSLQMPEQKEKLEEVFSNWKGNFKQIDDIIVLGIQI